MKTLSSTLAALALLTVASGAQANGTLDFDIPASKQGGASVSYAGGSAPLVGNNIVVTDVTGLGTPANTGVSLNITGGLLSFTTGNFLNSNGGAWNFDAGGNLTITGAISALGLPANSTLLSATFSSASVSSSVPGPFRTLGLYFDPPNSAIASYFGLPANKYAGGFEVFFGLDPAVPPGSAFGSSFVASGETQTSPVPAPGILVLLCSGGTASLAGYFIRKKKVAAKVSSV